MGKAAKGYGTTQELEVGQEIFKLKLEVFNNATMGAKPNFVSPLDAYDAAEHRTSRRVKPHDLATIALDAVPLSEVGAFADMINQLEQTGYERVQQFEKQGCFELRDTERGLRILYLSVWSAFDDKCEQHY